MMMMTLKSGKVMRMLDGAEGHKMMMTLKSGKVMRMLDGAAHEQGHKMMMTLKSGKVMRTVRCCIRIVPFAVKRQRIGEKVHRSRRMERVRLKIVHTAHL